MPFDHFDIISGLYNRIAKYSPPARLLDLLDLPPNGLLLDAGGGTGRVAEALRLMVREVVVADLSRGMLRHAVDKSLTTTCAPVELLPFASETFERIIIVDALHHVLDMGEAITELWRVLAPGGRIFIIEPDIHKFVVKLIATGEKILLMRSHFLTAENISTLLARQNTQVRVVLEEFNVWVYADKGREM